jgi:hypothetical protein
MAFCARRDRHLERCQEQCRSSQNAEGLLPIEVVSGIFNWSPYTVYDGTTKYAFYGMVSGPGREGSGECDGNGLSPDDINPFPSQVYDVFFRASDLIEWIEGERRENRRGEERAGWR